MEDDNYSQKGLCAYQSAWSISVLLAATLALTLPIANIVMLRKEEGHLSREVGLDVDVLKCLISTCDQKWDKKFAMGPVETILEHPSFVWRTRIASLGTILFFIFTGVILTMQAPSILIYGCSTNFFPHHANYLGCCLTNPESSLRLMVVGAFSLNLGLLWYAVVMMPVLNGGSFLYGYWVTQMTALSSLVAALGAYRDKNIWDSFYHAIPDPPEQFNRFDQLDDLLDYEPKLSHLDVYQTAPSLSSIIVFDESQIAA